ncbi:MAG: hypothetical protein ACRDZO_10210 [Egibacteraceae bacterium]
MSSDTDACGDPEPARGVAAGCRPAWLAGSALAMTTLAFWVGLPLLATFGPSPASLWEQIDPRVRAAAVFGLIFGLVYGVLRVISAVTDLSEYRDR